MDAIAYIPGDGIGPEIMNAAVRVIDVVMCGEIEWFDVATTDFRPLVYEQEAVGTILDIGVALKGPISSVDHSTMPWGNDFFCRYLDVSTQVRACRHIPGVPGSHRLLDLVIVSELPGEEQTFEKTVQRAMNLARLRQGKISLVLRDDLHLKFLLPHLRAFNALIAEQGLDLKVDRWNLRPAVAHLHTWPGSFDVIVTDQLSGSVLSAQAGALMGGLGLTSRESSGGGTYLFETGHGTAPGLTGQGIANPAGLMFAGVKMLEHLNKKTEAERLSQAIMRTLADIRTRNIGGTANTEQFTQAVLAKL